MELRNGEHKYEPNLQAAGSIYSRFKESTNYSSYFSDLDQDTGPCRGQAGQGTSDEFL